MLVTVTPSPPSWAARLPQVFSAATTTSRPVPAVCCTGSHPDAIRTTASTPRVAGRRGRAFIETAVYMKLSIV